MSFKLSQTSLRALKGVHPDLVKVVKRAIQISPIDFKVIEGVRKLERQKQLKARGATQTLNSRHLTGHAVDIVPLFDKNKDGRVSSAEMFDWPAYYPLAAAIKQAARELGVPLEWGGDWKKFKDGPHWQLPWKSYPLGKDVELAREVVVEKPITNKTEARVATENAAAVAGGATASVAIGADQAEKVVEVISQQQGALSSGDWVQIGLSLAILGLTLFVVWRRS